ncbi:MAG: 4a-hydroxytetrahydrobiopterin dehydratase [Nitrolancea sp.]
MTRLTEADLGRELAQLEGWQMEERVLRKEFRFKTFSGAMKFVNQVADIARSQRHHPEIWNSYNRVRLSLTTHDEGGISDKDVAFARAVEDSRNPA